MLKIDSNGLGVKDFIDVFVVDFWTFYLVEYNI
jgi:hypothetical protein